MNSADAATDPGRVRFPPLFYGVNAAFQTVRRGAEIAEIKARDEALPRRR
jgi:hypothetical protein